MEKSRYDYDTQEAVNPAFDVVTFGATAVPEVRAIHSNVNRKMKCRFTSGTEVVVAFLSGMVYPYRVTKVMASNGSNISSTSALVIGLR